MRTLSSYALCVLFSGIASAQLFSVGIKAGVPLTDAFADQTFPSSLTTGLTVHSFGDSKKFVAGGTVELHLPLGFSVEADGLYRPLRLTMVTTIAGSAAGGKDSADYVSWEVPILGKYRFLHTPLIKPYVAGGPSFRILEAPLDHFMSTHGFALGGGIEFKVSRLRISPELRYTLWGSDSNFAFEAKSNQNQVELLIGLTW